MATGSTLTLAAAAVAALSLGGCGTGAQKAPPPRQPDAYASREPGSDTSPTNDASFQLLDADGPTRFASFQALLIAKGKACTAVTRAILEGGLDGTDEWRVDCAGSGRWQVWFRPDVDPDINHCANAACA